jgi:hypothetical protein
MAFYREFDAQENQRQFVQQVPWTASAAAFVVPLALVLAAAVIGWILYGNLSPTVDNTGTTTHVVPSDLPQATPKASGP